jgi:mRNA interferase RelE/StbE
VVLQPAQRSLQQIQSRDQQRIIEMLDLLVVDPTMLPIRPLEGRPEMRLRVGKYRVLFVPDQARKTHIVTAVAPL